MRSTLSDPVIEECIEDAIYFALGLVNERHASRDPAPRVLYHPLVRSGMSREKLFELIDDGSIPIPD